eukprot:superscaffoldBa00004583_g19120
MDLPGSRQLRHSRGPARSVNVTQIRTKHNLVSTYLVPSPPEPQPNLPIPAPSPAPLSREPQIPSPEHYTGDLGTCRAFVMQCALVFEQQPIEKSKISYIMGLLAGSKTPSSQGEETMQPFSSQTSPENEGWGVHYCECSWRPCYAGANNPCHCLPKWTDENFLDANLAAQPGITNEPLATPLNANTLNSKLLANITHRTKPLHLIFSSDHLLYLINIAGRVLRGQAVGEVSPSLVHPALKSLFSCICTCIFHNLQKRYTNENVPGLVWAIYLVRWNENVVYCVQECDEMGSVVGAQGGMLMDDTVVVNGSTHSDVPSSPARHFDNGTPANDIPSRFLIFSQVVQVYNVITHRWARFEMKEETLIVLILLRSCWMFTVEVE